MVSGRLRFGAAALLVIGGFEPASLGGQAPRAYVGGGAGVVAPQGSFGDVESVGWQVSALGVVPLGGRWGVGVQGLYGRLGHAGGVDGATTLGGGTVSGVFFLGGDAPSVRPFVMAGVGGYRVNVSVPQYFSAASTKLAFGAGGGVLVRSGGRRVFVVVQYVTVRTAPEATSFVPVGVGVVWPVGVR